MNSVFVLNHDRSPLMPTSSAKARILLDGGKAAVLRRYPFTIILKQQIDSDRQELQLKVDPGSKETGIALVNLFTKKVLFAMVITHRGQAIKSSLESRRAIRRGRRNRNTRYRAPRFDNRTRPKGWLAPSLMHRVETIITWVNRIKRFAPVTGLSQELVRFDMQKMENPEISGSEYQQGTLAGYEVREYLLNKWHRKCSYCGTSGIPLQVEHIEAKANGGTNRISNLCLACEPCNTKKGTLDVKVFLKNKPELLKKILAQAKAPLKDAAAVNATRWRLFETLKATGLPVETGSGGRTKFNRITQGFEKQHWIDAACVGVSGSEVIIPKSMSPLLVKATGHGCRQVTRTDRFGFPRQTAKKGGAVFGFQTGDIVKAIITKGKKIGTYTGKVAVRASGSFNVTMGSGCISGVSHKCCELLHSKDGYQYA